MIWALAGAAAGLFCVVGGLMFWGLRRTVTRAAAATAARITTMETLLQDIADRSPAIGAEALEDLSIALKDDLAIMFTYAGRLAAISHEQSNRVIARLDAMEGIEAPAPPDPITEDAPIVEAAQAAPVDATLDEAEDEDEDEGAADAPVSAPGDAPEDAPGLTALSLEDLDEDLSDADDGAGADEAPAAETPAWALEEAAPAQEAEALRDEVPEAPDPGSLQGVLDAATGALAPDDADPAEGDDLLADELTEINPLAQPVDIGAAPAELHGATQAFIAAQQDAAARIEDRLSAVAAGIMALSASTETSERLDAIAASGDTHVALLSALAQDVGAGLASLDAGQAALRTAIEGMGAADGDAAIVGIVNALTKLQSRTETLSHAVDAAAGAVGEAAEAAAASVLAAGQDRMAADEARLEALCERIAGFSGGADGSAMSGDALGALSGQVDELHVRVAEMADLAAAQHDALARLEDAVTPDRLRVVLDAAAERLDAAAASRRAASRIVDMPDLPAPRPTKAAGESPAVGLTPRGRTGRDEARKDPR